MWAAKRTNRLPLKIAGTQKLGMKEFVAKSVAARSNTTSVKCFSVLADVPPVRTPTRNLSGTNKRAYECLQPTAQMPPMSWTNIASEVLTALFVAVPTAFFTVRLSLKRFYQEKWWESKRSTYMELFSALHHLKRIEEDWYYQVRFPEHHQNDSSLGDEKHAAEQRYVLEKTIDLSSFLISEEATLILQEYVAARKIAKREDPDDTNGLHRDALDKCVKSLKVAARKDLRINS